MKLLVTTAADLHIHAPEGVQVVPFDERADVPAADRDAEAVVLWGSNPDLGGLLRGLPRLRWVQSLSAGVERFVAAPVPPNVILTTGQHFHDRTVAEHALALTLAAVRRLPQALDSQRAHRWDPSLTAPQPWRPDGGISSLYGAQVAIWGFGGIGQQAARLFAAFGAHVTGIARSAGTRAGFRVVGPDRVTEALAGVDVLVMVLPSTPQTAHALDGPAIAALPRHAWVVNVGRGSTIDEDALVQALRTGRIAGAALDVMAHEPLPADSPLWDAPHTILTPHAAGGRPLGASERIERNLRSLLTGQPLEAVYRG